MERGPPHPPSLQQHATATTMQDSRFLVVDGEADEVPVVWGPVPVPCYDDAVLPRVGGGEVQHVALTWGAEVHP